MSTLKTISIQHPNSSSANIGLGTDGSVSVGTAMTFRPGELNIIGVATATTFSGNITGTAATFTGNISASTFSGNVTGTAATFSGAITAASASFSGNVSIAGTLTYEDVTNVDSVGLITARSGVVLTGGNATLGTGVTISGSTANVFTVSTNGSERVRVGNSGNIGIGTISADTKLDVFNSGSTSSIIRTRNQVTSVYLDANNGYAYLNTFSNNPLLFGTNNSERFRIGSSGQLGIGGENYGTSGQVLTSQGSGAAPQWATLSTGSMVFINSVTASNSASVAFTSGIDSTYGVYVITYTSVQSNSAFETVAFYARLSKDGGSTYLSGSSDYTNGVMDLYGQGNRSFIPITNAIWRTSSNYPTSGVFYLFNPSLSGGRIMYTSNHAGSAIQDVGGGRANQNGPYNAIQFYLESDSIASGTFRLYGIKNS